MKISLDFDGVLSHTMKSWVIKYNKKHGKDITTRAIEKWGFYEDLGIDVDECFAIFDEAWADIDTLESIEQDIWQKTKMLNNIGHVDIVTSVHAEWASKIKEWLDKQGVIRHKIVFTDAKWELDYDVFIDDSADNILKIADKGKIALLYNQPWNRHINQSRSVYRVYNLYHAIDMLRDLVKGNVLC